MGADCEELQGFSPCPLTVGPGGADGVKHNCQLVVPAGTVSGPGPGRAVAAACKAEVGFWAHAGGGGLSEKQTEGSLILSTRGNRVWPGSVCWGSSWFGQSKGHQRGYLPLLPPLVDTLRRMDQGKWLGCRSAAPPPSFPGNQGPDTLN